MMQRRRIFPAIIVSSILLLVTACATDLTSVREWSSTSLEATQYDELVTTYANTPERLKRYDNSTQWDEQVALRNNQAESLKQLLAVVSDYMFTLATLSADSTIDYSKEVGTLNTNIKQLNAGISSKNKRVPEETLGAAGTLVKTMLVAATKFYQAKQVAQVVEDANEPLQEIIGEQGYLYQIINEDFRRDLKTESSSIGGFYKNLSRKDNTSDAAKESMMEWKELRLIKNAKQLEAINAYLAVLNKISTGHQKLYDNRHALDAKDLVKQLHALAAELRKQIQILARSN